MMNRRGSDGSDNSFQNGPELRSIRMGAASASNGPSIAFATGLRESKHVEEPLDVNMNKPLHTEEWNVPEELPAIPSDYALGYSHTIIDDASPQTVANRIVEGLAKHSIATSPHESHENSLLAEATCGLKFAVNLFQVGNGNSGVVVEVERRIGCSYGFHLCSNGVIKAAKGMCEPLTCKAGTLGVPKCIPPKVEEERRQCIQFDIEQALEMIRSERTDAQLLGLQSLERLSLDEYAASILHTNENIGSIQSFLVNEAPTCVMKRRALGILANIMKHSPERERCDKLQCEHFLKALFTAMQNFSSSPHEACAATKCLQSSLELLSQDKYDDLAEILNNFVGRSSHPHSELALESKMLQERLRQQR